MVKSLNFFFIGDCPISLFRSPLTVEVLMMGPMQSGSKFTDRITKYLTKSAEQKTTRASKSKGHVISHVVFFFTLFPAHTFLILILQTASYKTHAC